jgi:dGTP triphosphohydrolase
LHIQEVALVLEECQTELLVLFNCRIQAQDRYDYFDIRIVMYCKAYSIQMHFGIPESEKRIAEKAEEYFDLLLTDLQDIKDYLNLIYIPFQKHQNIDMEMITDYRKTFKEYRDQVKLKFQKVVKKAYKCVALMNEFSTDTATEEIMESFVGTIRELDKYIDTFVSIFSNLNSSEFRNHLISTIDSLKKQMNQIEQLIKDRILEHIDSNILAKNWAKNLSDRFEDSEPIEERVPLVVQLFKERQKALQEGNGR